MKHRPVICILDDDKERCLREERALDMAIRLRNVRADGFSNHGANHLARTGLDHFPAIDIDGVYFTPKSATNELTCELLCGFLDMLLKKGIIEKEEID